MKVDLRLRIFLNSKPVTLFSLPFAQRTTTKTYRNKTSPPQNLSKRSVQRLGAAAAGGRSGLAAVRRYRALFVQQSSERPAGEDVLQENPEPQDLSLPREHRGAAGEGGRTAGPVLQGLPDRLPEAVPAEQRAEPARLLRNAQCLPAAAARLQRDDQAVPDRDTAQAARGAAERVRGGEQRGDECGSQLFRAHLLQGKLWFLFSTSFEE